YGLARFSIEFLRGDPRVYIGPLSLPQWFSILAMAGAVSMLIFLHKKEEKK
ncbi:MAG: prolipoprotein diacylglyceryl transferase, partial [Aquificota bacterium]